MPESRPYQRILALIHFDELDSQVVGKALLLAQQNQAALELLHLIEPDGALDGGYFGGAQATARTLERAASRRMHFLAATLGADAACCHAVYGPRRQRLVQYIENARPDLVVTGEAHAYLADLCDTLILSPRKRPRGSRLLATLQAWLGGRAGAAGV